MDKLLLDLTLKDDKKAYESLKKIIAISFNSNEYYKHLDYFASLLTDEKSYIRTRAFLLICAQAKWDKENKISDLLPLMSTLLNDPKPTVVRQSLKALKEVIAYKPELHKEIKKYLSKIDISKYKDSMSPLIQKDIEELL